MSTRGRHARRSSLSFYRDALLLFGGIVIVGALVFGGLSLWAGRAGGDETSAAPGPTSTVPPATETTTTTTTTAPPSTTEATAPFTTSTEAVPEAPETTVRAARPPSEVRAVVLNSIGVTGLAGRVSQQLADAGYQMAQADNYTPELSDTMIFHAEDYAIEAHGVRETLGTGEVAEDADITSQWGVDIVVILGRSFQE